MPVRTFILNRPISVQYRVCDDCKGQQLDGALGISNDKSLVAMWNSTVGSFKNLWDGNGKR